MEYYSIKDMANKLNIPKQKVYRCIKRYCINEAHQEAVKGNTVLMYDDVAFKRITELLGISYSASFDVPNDTLFDALLKQSEELKANKKMLINQLAEKDKQISELQQALNQEQQLHLLSKQRVHQLEAVNDAVEEKSKKGFWERIFGK